MAQRKLVEEIKERGVRITPQRAIILEAIEEMPGHVTAEEVYTRVQQVNAYISLTTIYRTLDLLSELGLITQTNMGTATTHYALHTHATHHHALCRSCGRTFELPDDLFAPVVDVLQREHQFEADIDHLVVFGRCQDCQP